MDLEMWDKFVKHPSVFCRPFIDLSEEHTSKELDFYIDSSRNFSLGFGGYCYTSWMQGHWEPFLCELEPSIQYLELYALMAAILVGSVPEQVYHNILR